MPSKKQYLQLAFNSSFQDFLSVIRLVPENPNIIIEAGTPLIKREGVGVVSKMRQYWSGNICADIKVVDGAKDEVEMAKQAGATHVTALGNASKETLNIFVQTCKDVGLVSVIDMINTPNPLKSLWAANIVPDLVVIHRGRDEESSFGEVIQYKNISKIKGKWDISLGAAGGIDQKEMQSASFNGADVVVVNVVRPSDPWEGLVIDENIKENIDKFLRFVL